MDLFDDILLGSPAARARSGGKFVPKVKSKQPPQKEISASVHATSSQRVSVNKDTVALVDDLPFTTTANAVENELNNVAAPSLELPTCTNEVQSLQSNGDGSGGLNQSTSLPLPTSEILRTIDISNKFDYVSSSIPFSEDNRNFAALIPSQPDSLNAMPSEAVVHNGTRDWSSSFGKSAAETADISSRVESLDVFLTQAATGTVQRCPEYHTTQDSLTFNEAGVVNEDDSHTNNSRSETQEGARAYLNRDCSIDNVFDYQSMKSGTYPTSEIPMHEELTNSADCSTLADFLHQDATGEKEDANERKYSLRTHRRSSITGVEDKDGETLRQLRKQVARKPDNSLNDDDDDLDPPYDCNSDELEEYDEVDYSSKKKRASTTSKNRFVVKNRKTSQKRKRVKDDLEKTNKEPPKKLSHSTRRRKRCVDKALLDDDELVLQNLPMRDIILITDCRERLAKKEATTSKTSSTNQSGGDFLREAGANNEDEIFGSEEPDDDQAGEKITPTSSLFNYQSFMDKAPRAKWSKQETEEFYEAVSQFGTEFTMIQLLFPEKTRCQVKLKYKKEERQHPLQLFDAENNRARDLSCFKSVIERQPQTSTKA